MKYALLCLCLAGCATQPPAGPIPAGYVPYVYQPYVIPPPYQMPTNQNTYRPPVNCYTRSVPGLGGPTLTTVCQ